MSEMLVQNEYLPANHQGIDDIPTDYETESETEFEQDPTELSEVDSIKTDPVELAEAVVRDPSVVGLLTKNQLAMAYEALDAQMEEIESAKSVVKDTIFSLMDTDSEEVGNYLAIKVTKPVFKTLTLDQARELGLTKVEEKIDHALVKKAWKAGANVGEVDFDVMNVLRKRQAGNAEEVL